MFLVPIYAINVKSVVNIPIHPPYHMVIFYNMKNKEDYRLRKFGDILARANTLQKENGLAYIVKLGTTLLYKKLKSYFLR